MNDFIALSITRMAGANEARSALPQAPVVDDGYAPRPAKVVRRSLAASLRTAAAVEHRWANRLDPVACRARGPWAISAGATAVAE